MTPQQFVEMVAGLDRPADSKASDDDNYEVLDSLIATARLIVEIKRSETKRD